MTKHLPAIRLHDRRVVKHVLTTSSCLQLLPYVTLAQRKKRRRETLLFFVEGRGFNPHR